MLNDIWIKSINTKDIELYEWKWCDDCNNSWYKWRIWIYEIINLNEKIREIIRWWWSVNDVIKEARNWDLITIKEDWILKAMKWYTTIEEILRVI
jgi:type II secretory ATPase GspE/PulE/Tfp pilus assembly ATPase PilB-like protein